MENIETLYEKIKKEDSGKINEILKDIIIIDGAIVQNSKVEYKKDICLSLEEKYKEQLQKLMYHKVKDIVEYKTEEYIDSNIKSLNTKLGNLKNMLIRVASIRLYSNQKIKELEEKIKKEINPEQIYKFYLEIDDQLVNYIK